MKIKNCLREVVLMGSHYFVRDKKQLPIKQTRCVFIRKTAYISSKAVVLLLLIYCLMYFPLFVGVLCLSLFSYALLCGHSSNLQSS